MVTVKTSRLEVASGCNARFTHIESCLCLQDHKRDIFNKSYYIKEICEVTNIPKNKFVNMDEATLLTFFLCSYRCTSSRKRQTLFQVVLPIEASLSPHDPLAKWEDHMACWQMCYRGALGESLLHVLIICDTKVR